MNQTLKDKIIVAKDIFIFFLAALLTAIFGIREISFFFIILSSISVYSQNILSRNFLDMLFLGLPFYLIGFFLYRLFVKNKNSKLPQKVFCAAIFLLLIYWSDLWIARNFFPNLEWWLTVNNFSIGIYINSIISFGLGFSFSGFLIKKYYSIKKQI